MPRPLRGLLAQDLYFDVDCANAGPTILEQLARRKGWACNHLTWYNANRNACLGQLMAASGRGRCHAKKVITAVYFEAPLPTTCHRPSRHWRRS